MTKASEAKISRFERICNLALRLMEAEQPLTLDQLVQSVPGYPVSAAEETLRAVFERDKRILREQGVQIETAEANGRAGGGYELVDEGCPSSNVELSDAESAALSLALSLFAFDDVAAWDAMAKLATAGDGAVGRSAFIRSAESIAALTEGAVASRRTLRFSYKSRVCDIEPYGLATSGGRRFLVGRDRHHEGQRIRCFDVAQIRSQPVLGAADGYEIPLHFDPRTHLVEAVVEGEAGVEEEIPDASANRAIDAGQRYRRLMAILSYLGEVGEVRLDDLADRFQLRACDLKRELELGACFGVAPFTPDALLGIVVNQDVVVGFGLDRFRRGNRLTAGEALVAAQAGHAFVSFAGVEVPEALQSALVKLQTATGELCEREVGHTLVWPSERSVMVRLRLREIAPIVGRIMLSDPVLAGDGRYEVQAFLADRRWSASLLSVLGDEAEIDGRHMDTDLCGRPERRAA